eukprot:51480-Eustigmatos_ZCMA.PRE.1
MVLQANYRDELDLRVECVSVSVSVSTWMESCTHWGMPPETTKPCLHRHTNGGHGQERPTIERSPHYHAI